MPILQAQKIKPGPETLSNLIQKIQDGTIRIPGFQRDFVWESRRIQTLLDSMCREYPIGTLFLWKAPPDYNDLLRDVPFFQQPPVEAGRSYEFLLDGQQRLTSLFVTVHGLTVDDEDYSQIVLDLEQTNEDKPLFTRRKIKPGDERYIPVKDLLAFSLPGYVRKLPDELYARFERYRSILSNYPCSVVTVTDMKLDDAIEIFERINRQGRRLDRFDLITASVYSKDFDLRERTNKDILNKLADDFGELSPSSVPQLLALNTRGLVDTPTQLKLTAKDIVPIWSATSACFHAAVDLLRGHFGVVSKEFLPYDAMLPVLSYYFYHSGKRHVASNHLPQIERWFWHTAFGERYSGTNQNSMTQDAAWVRELISNEAPFRESLTIKIDQLVDARMTASTAIRNAFFCLLRLQQPLSFANGVELPFRSKDYLGFMPTDHHRLFLGEVMKSRARDVYRLQNFCFLGPLADELHKPGMKVGQFFAQVRDAFPQRDKFERIMDSHLLPTDANSGLWQDDFDLLCRQRAAFVLARPPVGGRDAGH